MVTYLPALVRSIEDRPNDKKSDRSNEFIWWLIKAELIEQGSWRTFSLFPRSYQDVVTDQMVTDRMTNTNEFIWWLIKPNSLKEVRDAFSCGTFPLFPRSYQKHGDRSNERSKEFSWWLIKPNSLKKVHDVSFCRTFSLFPRSYQTWWSIEWKIKKV